ncbi:MAG: tetratricopeptide repeat protein [Marinobacter sp.]|uniref:tetratricopeptide repeat protein n=1 Tax=Marinobacter sp. TaxID=50741 RepID=UPI00329850F3
MSLLNDALRAAEQRQNRPAPPGAYAGGQHQPRNGRPLLLSVLVVALFIAAVGGYWVFAKSFSTEPMVLESQPSPDQTVQRDIAIVVDEQPVSAPVDVLPPAPQPEVVESAPQPRQTVPPKPEVAEAEARKPEPAVASSSSVDEAAAEQEAKSSEVEETQPQETSTAGVKQVPQTPAAKDRSSARELERLVARGNITDAERGLAALTQEQMAPRSRYVVARALLVEGKQDQALGWLPEDVATEHPKLRLLRARAQHANGDLAAAVDTLSATVPPVEGHSEYRVTLATLLQQQGMNGEAARHWAELIAWDDSQGPWWVGLAISLEAQGEQVGAARAYQQAAKLPGLPRSLADYVQRRLQALRAG